MPNPTIAAFYNRLTADGKKPKVALTACRRKLPVILNPSLLPPRPPRLILFGNVEKPV
tara:strand:+ start:476 stop:649 length:174 start_codon:yes stop_codon:yes gene_type:complete